MGKISVQVDMVVQISRAIYNRVLVFKELPAELDYNWKVEDRHMIKEWDRWYEDYAGNIEAIASLDIFGMEESDFNKFSYFVYFFWFFVNYTTYNTDRNEKDSEFIAGCGVYLNKYIGEEGDFDIVELFYKAFPDSRKKGKKK